MRERPRPCPPIETRQWVFLRKLNSWVLEVFLQHAFSQRFLWRATVAYKLFPVKFKIIIKPKIQDKNDFAVVFCTFPVHV